MAPAGCSCAAAFGARSPDAINLAQPGCMKTALPEKIESLFARHPALCGFSVRGLDELPDNCPRSDDDDGELYIGDVGISPALSHEQFGEIFREIVVALAELIAEEPEAGEALRGRTFARILH